ncbi:SAM-dependent chlorinase/fluorinase [Candidatus Bathyarchaeota archaeon]|nr:SAM-dependent chlorinase/fluorinase [Candidatus Bathyarchaeota archaeon]
MGASAIITLLTDFGLRDPYVAEMKGTILSICPEARIVDITHEVEKFNVKMGAYILASSTPHFPEGTIHVAVVDPGVGTERKAIIIRTARSVLIGPDNGLLALSAMREGVKEVFAIENPKYMAEKPSKTFHGRDIFCRAAAYICKGVPVSDFGPKIDTFIKPEFSLPRYEYGRLRGEIIHIDGFGNAITNVTGETLEKLQASVGSILSLQIESKKFKIKLCETYGDVPKGEKLLLIGSDGFLEISVNQGNAAKSLNLKVGDEVLVSPIA